MDLKGKVILVTGAAGSGVGGGVCQVLQAHGARLVINDRDKEPVDATVQRYPGSIAAAADISDAGEVELLFQRLEGEGIYLDGLVNNAGVGLNRLAHEASEDDFDALYAVNIKGVWRISKYFARQQLQRGGNGSIVNISSVHARATVPKFSLYASTKSAVEGLTRGMAAELGKYNIRVNAVAPGYVHSDQNNKMLERITPDPEGWIKNYVEQEQLIPRVVRPEDCGNVAAFLLSEASCAVTGQVIYVDNGDTVKLLGSIVL